MYGSTTHKTFTTTAQKACLAALLLPVALAGCGHRLGAQSTTPVTPGGVLVAADRSESTDKFRGAMLDQLDLAADMAASDHVPLEVWAFDTAPVQIYSGSPGSHDDIAAPKRKQLAPDKFHPRRITRPALLLEAWLHDRALHPMPNTYAVILSDGDSEVYTDKPRLFAAARALGKDPTFRLAVIGINPEDRKMWDDALSAAMPGRYVLAGEEDGQAQAARFLQGKATR